MIKTYGYTTSFRVDCEASYLYLCLSLSTALSTWHINICCALVLIIYRIEDYNIKLPMHTCLLLTKPCWHTQRYEPIVFTHSCLSPQMFGLCSHSSTSTAQEIPVYPGLHTHPLTLSQVTEPSSLQSHILVQSAPHTPIAHSRKE